MTRKGAKERNFEVDKILDQFEQHLMDNGFSKSTINTKKGPINTFSKDGVKEFTTRGFSTSTDGPTGELFRGGEKAAKIRFQEGN